MTRASVIVCTHNRAALLTRCVERVAAQTRERPDVEIVVVDNASTDGTAIVARELQRRVEGLRCSYEPMLGLSRARNHAMQVADGELLLFIDDDAIVHDGWLDAMLAAYADTEVSAVAGKIQLDSVARRPWWFVPEVDHLFSAFDLGERPRLLVAGECPFGANMSVRHDAALQAGGFPEDLGRVGAGLLSYEETAFFANMMRRGMAIAYEPRAVVTHALPSERLTIRYLVRRSYAQGRSEARLHERLVAEGGSWFDGSVSHALARATLRGWRGCAVHLTQRGERRGVLAQELERRSTALGFALERVRNPRVGSVNGSSARCAA
jgi:glycosyltransferase involved in cell wall biosynthesis